MDFEIVEISALKTERSNEWLWTELLVLAGLIISGLTIGKADRHILILSGLVWVGLTTVLYKHIYRCPWRDMGLHWKNSLATLGLLKWALLCVAAICYVNLVTDGSWQNFAYFPLAQIGYMLGGWLQQFLLGPYLALRLKKLLRTDSEVAGYSAIAFCLSHFPNPLLMAVSLIGGWVSVRVFLRDRNYYTLSLCHWLIGAALAAALPPWLMLVGRGFWPHAVRLARATFGF